MICRERRLCHGRLVVVFWGWAEGVDPCQERVNDAGLHPDFSLVGHPAVDDEVTIRVNQLITVSISRLHAFSECFQMAAEVVGQNFSVGIRM